jgi:sugar O-acyltransferase (sialic acid O-acetyltransferase NeuD family)
VVETFLSEADFDVIGLIDDEPENAGRRINGLSVVGSQSDLPRLASEGVEGVVLGFGAAAGRDAVVDAVDSAGLALPTLIHPSAHVSTSATLAAGVQVLPQASVGPNARIGRGALVNTGAIVEHDATISDYVVVGPRAVLAGRSTVGESTEIGAAAVLLPDGNLGAGSVIGAGSVVTHPVHAGQTVAGVPARPTRPASYR